MKNREKFNHLIYMEKTTTGRSKQCISADYFYLNLLFAKRTIPKHVQQNLLPNNEKMNKNKILLSVYTRTNYNKVKKVTNYGTLIIN